MAPHWKCGSGQPVEGSNPSLSATTSSSGPIPASHQPGWWYPATARPTSSRRRSEYPGPRSRREEFGSAVSSTALDSWIQPLELVNDRIALVGLVALGTPPDPRAMTPKSAFDIVALPMGEFTFAPGEEYAGQTGVVVAYAIRHPGGVFLFDTGFGFGNDELDDYYKVRARARARRARRRRHRPRRDHRRRELPPARRPLGPERVCSPASRSTSSRPSGRPPTSPTTRSSSGSTSPARATSRSPATTRSRPGSASSRRPGTRPGHQSLVVDSPDGHLLLAGQAVYSHGEWSGIAGAREGASVAPDQPGVRPLGRAPARPSSRSRSCSATTAGAGRNRPPPTPGVSLAGRARRGTSGALYLQSAPAGLNSSSRPLRSEAAAPGGVEDRVPRSGESRTVSGPEGSSTQRSSSGAAERPDLSRLLRWARVPVGRQGVHGI